MNFYKCCFGKLMFIVAFSCITSCTYSQSNNDTTITQTISYKTEKAGELYLVWYIDWSIPDKNFWPKNTIVNIGKACSKMEKRGGTFSVSLSLPKRTQVQYMFWAPVDNKGDSTDGWDTYGDQLYSSDFKESKTITLNDSALWMPENDIEFNIIKVGGKTFFGALLCIGVLITFFRKKLSFSINGLVVGFLFALTVFFVIIRMQMNELFDKLFLVPGAIFYDLIWIIGISIFFFLIISLFHKYRRLQQFFISVYFVLLLLSALLALLNIEIVNNLGRPLNYQWLYYSNFMTGADAKRAVQANLPPEYVFDISLILLSLITIAIIFSMLPLKFVKRANRALIVLGIILLGVSCYQVNAKQYENGKIKNPVSELITSTILSENSDKLFSMKVSDEIRAFIERYHSQQTDTKVDTNAVINNIIVFVLESTPKHFVSIYDSTYNVTPNLKKWKNISTAFTNMYAHMPATVYSMGSINSGVYPLISYKSLVANYTNNTIPTLSGVLSKEGWQTSLFFAADLTYSNMGKYAKSHAFNTVEDNTNMVCSFAKFGNTNTFLDQLDDRCLSTRYLSWFDTVKTENKFSLLWTTQTHYPYLARPTNTNYTDKDENLNAYLKGLRDSDEAFGILMDGLQKRGVLKNTLVIVTADHGEAFGTHNQIAHATKIYEENIHIPLIIYNPALFHGSYNNRICGLIDLAPTITHIKGIKKPEEWEGKSLFSDVGANDRTFFICPFNDFLFGTRNSNWKYIYNASTNESELYDLQTDPNELTNVALQHKEITMKEFEMVSAWVQYHDRKLKPFLK